MTIQAPASSRRLAAATLGSLLLTACAGSDVRDAAPAPAPTLAEPTVRVTEHRDGDDLLSAGLGLDGLRAAIPPALDDAVAPSAQALRRRAIWNNWRGIADLSPAGGYGEAYGGAPDVPGREFHALLRLPDARAPHRVMLQLPDAFDADKPCLVVTAASGSRGIYGAIALASAWGLPRGCAVVHTDKGAGSDLYDGYSGSGFALDGRATRDIDAMAFHEPSVEPVATPWLAYKHAHSQDNPEADWGRHLRQAADFALARLDEALPTQAPFTYERVRVIAVGLSNAGGVVLRAAEQDDDWLDGVVAVAPNVLPGSGGRALLDYATEAALWMGCAQAAPALALGPSALPPALIAQQRAAACEALRQAGLAQGEDAEIAVQAHALLREAGWTDAALQAGALSTAFDLWRSVAVSYASAYARTPANAMPCGHGFALLDAEGKPRAAIPEERAAWWSDGSGIVPGLGVSIIERGEDRAPLAGLRCLRALAQGEGEHAAVVAASIEATRAALPREGLPVLVIHGVDDGLIPEAFSARAYVDWARAGGRRPLLAYWRIRNAQHFDAFLGLPEFGARYFPLLPYAYRGLDALSRQLDGGAPVFDADVQTLPRRLGADGVPALTVEHLALPGG